MNFCPCVVVRTPVLANANVCYRKDEERDIFRQADENTGCFRMDDDRKNHSEVNGRPRAAQEKTEDVFSYRTRISMTFVTCDL